MAGVAINGYPCPTQCLMASLDRINRVNRGADGSDREAGGAETRKRIRRGLGFAGVAAALPFFLWLPLGWLGLVPSMVDVFGVAGLRVPASIVVGGLLVAAIGFWEF